MVLVKTKPPNIGPKVEEPMICTLGKERQFPVATRKKVLIENYMLVLQGYIFAAGRKAWST